jgi:hypothetical protein
MNEDQLAQYRHVLELGRVPDNKLDPQRIYLRGFNDGVKFAQEQLERALKSNVTTDRESREA